MGGSATLGALAEARCGVHLTCTRSVYVAGDLPGETLELHRLKQHAGLHLSAAEAAERWGADTTLDQIERRARCTLCAARWPHMAVEISMPTPDMGLG